MSAGRRVRTLAELRADREALHVHGPAAGTVPAGPRGEALHARALEPAQELAQDGPAHREALHVHAAAQELPDGPADTVRPSTPGTLEDGPAPAWTLEHRPAAAPSTSRPAPDPQAGTQAGPFTVPAALAGLIGDDRPRVIADAVARHLVDQETRHRAALVYELAETVQRQARELARDVDAPPTRAGDPATPAAPTDRRYGPAPTTKDRRPDAPRAPESSAAGAYPLAGHDPCQHGGPCPLTPPCVGPCHAAARPPARTGLAPLGVPAVRALVDASAWSEEVTARALATLTGPAPWQPHEAPHAYRTTVCTCPDPWSTYPGTGRPCPAHDAPHELPQDGPTARPLPGQPLPAPTGPRTTGSRPHTCGRPHDCQHDPQHDPQEAPPVVTEHHAPGCPGPHPLGTLCHGYRPHDRPTLADVGRELARRHQAAQEAPQEAPQDVDAPPCPRHGYPHALPCPDQPQDRPTVPPAWLVDVRQPIPAAALPQDAPQHPGALPADATPDQCTAYLAAVVAYQRHQRGTRHELPGRHLAAVPTHEAPQELAGLPVALDPTMPPGVVRLAHTVPVSRALLVDVGAVEPTPAEAAELAASRAAHKAAQEAAQEAEAAPARTWDAIRAAQRARTHPTTAQTAQHDRPEA